MKDGCYSVIDFAYQIIHMDKYIKILENENEILKRYKKDYEELLGSSIKHGEQMMGGILDIIMTPGVAEAFVNKKVNEKG